MSERTGNERYLRYILLLGEGVLLVLRGVVRREVQRKGSTLDVILTIPNNRRQIEQNCHSQTQRLHLFPTATSVNSDIETWDISLLTLVIQRVFWPNLLRDERLRISYLRDSRNEYQGHPPAMSMEETEYVTRSIDLETSLQALASGMDQQTRDTLTRIINDSNAIQFDFQTAIQNLQQLYEFKEDMLRELETKFQEVYTKLDAIQGNSNDHKQLAREVRTMHGNMHGDLLDVKALAEESNRIASASSRTFEVVQEALSIAREKSEQQQATLNRIVHMMAILMPHKGRQLQHDIEAIINANSEMSENATEAQDTIITSINDILEELRSVMEDRNNAEAIMQKVDELLLREEGRDNELTKALLKLIKDIIRHGNIQQARKGSIKLTVRFTSYSELISLLQYLCSEKFQERLNDISRALKNRTGHVVTLSGYIAQESLNDLHTHLEEEFKNLKCTRSVVLPVQCKGVVDLSHIWKLLQTGGADMHMKKLSEILTKMVGGTVTLTTSVNLKQFEQALLEESGTSDHFTKRGYGSGLTRSERKQTESAQKYKPHLEFSLTEKYSVKYGSDKYSPVITGIELLPDGKILLSDHWNSSLKMLDSSFNIVSYLDLSRCPCDMCYIGNDIVAVSLGWAGIRFACVSNDMIENQVTEKGHVCSLAFHGKTLYILNMYCEVYRRTAGGPLQRIPFKIEDISKNYTYKSDNLVDNKIAVSDDGEMIYLTLEVGLVTIDNKGNHKSTLRSDELRRPVDVCVVGDGTILVADKSNNVFRVDGRGTSILGKVSLTKVHLTAICYDRKKSRLIVGENSGYIHVFELQK